MLKYLPIALILLAGCSDLRDIEVTKQATDVTPKTGKADNLCHCPEPEPQEPLLPDDINLLVPDDINPLVPDDTNSLLT